MATEKRLRFYASDAFLERLAKRPKAGPPRGEFLAQAITSWDGRVRPFPEDWKGKRELPVPSDEGLQSVLAQFKGDRYELLFSAVVQQFEPRRSVPKAKTEEKAPPPAANASKVAERALSTPKAASKTPAQQRTKALVKPLAVVPPAPAVAAQPVLASQAGLSTAAKPPVHLHLVESTGPARAEPADLTPAQLQQLQTLLLESQKDIQARLAGAVGESVGREGDVADIASKSQDEEERQMLRGRLAVQLQQVIEALKLIREGDYGYCQETGEPIGWERLLANPTARFSVYAQTRREQSQRFRVA